MAPTLGVPSTSRPWIHVKGFVLHCILVIQLLSCLLMDRNRSPSSRRCPTKCWQWFLSLMINELIGKDWKGTIKPETGVHSCRADRLSDLPVEHWLWGDRPGTVKRSNGPGGPGGSIPWGVLYCSNSQQLHPTPVH